MTTAAWVVPDFSRRQVDPAWRDRLVQAARAVEREGTLLGTSAYFLPVARRPPGR